MSASTVLVVQAETSGATQIPASVAEQPPIVYFLQLASKFSVIAANFLLQGLRITWSLISYILNPIGSLVAAFSTPILYILSPLFLLMNLLTTILVYPPYNILVQSMHALYPVYAFLFIAIAIASAIGFSARLGTYATRLIFFHATQTEDNKPDGERTAVQDPDKARKKVQIKEEDRPHVTRVSKRRH